MTKKPDFHIGLSIYCFIRSRCLLATILVFIGTISCNNITNSTSALKGKKIGVLLVNHGSRSESWRKTILNLESSIRDTVLKIDSVHAITTAFMEYNEPSIATRLKEFDKQGFTDIIIVPVFLTVSPHSFDDIPTIIGQKNDPKPAELLKQEKIERYTPQARVHITQLLDFSDVLQKNVLRRVKSISKNALDEGLVMIAYGDETYTKEWNELLNTVGNYVSKETGITQYSFGWCGHIVHYNSDATMVAINKVLENKKDVIVIPVLVAVDEMFQIKIIGDGISKIKDHKNRVIYKPDAILPDKNIEHWAINVIAQQVYSITSK